ncbi:MAG: type VI secretion system tube protein Hcp [Verrucomicrobiae bacterium]|nr:type VI secretion system tube protein Hcp [Verrucomicrobiae bacterium]
MTASVRARFLAGLLALGIAHSATAAVAAFLKIDGVEGESTDVRHQGEIDVLSFSYSIVNSPPTGGGGGASKPVLSDLTISKYLDKSTPILHQRSAQGMYFRTAVLTLQKVGESPFVFYQVKLTDVRIVSVSTAGVAGRDDDRPIETVALAFGKVEWIYTPQAPDGTAGTPVEGSWDVARNSP